MLKEFRDFAIKGNVIDLAIGIIIGTAFGRIVTSLVTDIIMPPLGVLLSNVDFSNLYINLTRKPYATLADAKAAGAATINYGLFINNIINFIIVAFVIFLLVRAINHMKKPPIPAPIVLITKECPFCYTLIPLKATRCPNCTSELK